MWTIRNIVPSLPSTNTMENGMFWKVLRAVVTGTMGVYVSDASLCEILQACFRVCFETRVSGKRHSLCSAAWLIELHIFFTPFVCIYTSFLSPITNLFLFCGQNFWERQQSKCWLNSYNVSSCASPRFPRLHPRRR